MVRMVVMEIESSGDQGGWCSKRSRSSGPVWPTQHAPVRIAGRYLGQQRLVIHLRHITITILVRLPQPLYPTPREPGGTSTRLSMPS